ncbi:MAG: erythromycin esterase family protein [Planctomycetota bacterium]|jgi:erythromycin esterase
MRIATVLMVVAGLALAGDGNLLENGGFEKERDGWFFLSNSGRATFQFDKKTKDKGKRALRIDKQGGFPADVLGQNFDVDPAHRGGRYKVSVRVKGDGIANGWLKFYLYDAAGEVVVDEVAFGSLRGKFKWKTFKREFKVPETAVNGKLLVQVFVGGGTVWLDECAVVPDGAKARPKSKPLDKKTTRWLDKNAFPLATLDFDKGSRDLRPLRKVLRDVRIVQLGEPSHGDGAAFAAKARVIRFLHEEMGFNVLAFESGMYECERANRLMNPGADAREIMKAAIFGVWRTKRTLPIVAYAAKQAGTRSPLVLAGVDPQQSGGLAKEFVGDFLGFLEKGGVEAGKGAELLRGIETALAAETYEPVAGATEVFARLAKLVEQNRAALEARHGARETAFMARALHNYSILERLKRTEDGYVNLRDEWMGKNLIWLADEHFRDQKIVVWGATFHLAHELRRIKRGGAPDYQKTKAMGEYVHEHFGEQCYTVGFAAHGGRAGWWFKGKFDLSPPAANSIEETLFRYGKPLLFVDFRAKGGPFDKPLPLAALGYARNAVAPWPKILDGLIYIEEMVPATGMGG